MKQLRFLLGYVRPLWLVVLGGALLSAGAMCCQLAIPWLVRILIDDVLLAHRPDLLARTCGLLAIAAAGAFAFGAAERHTFRVLSGLAALRIQTGLARHLHALSLGSLRDRHSSQFTSLFHNDVPLLEHFYESILGESLYSAIRLVATLVVLAVVFKWMALVALLAAPVYLALSVPFTNPIRRAAVVLQQHVTAAAERLHETIAGAREIKAFGRGDFEVARLAGQFRSLLGPRLRLRLLQESATLAYLAFWSVACVIYWAAGRQVLAGQMTIGLLTALISYTSLIQEPFSRFVALNGELQAILASCGRVMAFLETPAEQDDSGALASLDRCEGNVEFQDVSFSYAPDRPVLFGISFVAQPGERIALVGPSGAGKSTLVSLIPKFFNPDQGRVLIDGRDVRGIEAASLRRKIGVVFQETFLFSATVRENLRFVAPGITDEEMVAAAVAANAHSFISALPEGYGTHIGERGAKLSVGQKQRLGIARALLQNPAILILDEATSALDSDSEAVVQEALERLMEGRTCLVIAHRLATVVNADRLLVVDAGRILASGTHRELLESCPLYQKLYALQYAEPVV
jgi:ABC-type multidrug transport system fused ATPase/permease subunit